jgi:hypothetical protein
MEDLMTKNAEETDKKQKENKEEEKKPILLTLY